MQIDLSDDLVALMMFADGEWEKQMSPVEYQDDKGATLHLKLEEREFREVSGGGKVPRASPSTLCLWWAAHRSAVPWR